MPEADLRHIFYLVQRGNLAFPSCKPQFASVFPTAGGGNVKQRAGL